MSEDWPHGAFGLSGERGATLRVRRTVLAVVHHLTSATRLADIVGLLESDARLQTVFTQAPSSTFGRGVLAHLESQGALTVPWRQATEMRWDLVIAASHGALEHLHAPIMVVPHGVGFAKYVQRWDGHGNEAPRPMSNVRPELVAHGRVVPSVMVLAHERQRAQLVAHRPEAAPAALVAGDPTYDRMLASLRLRETYRTALGATETDRLIVASSTWGRTSLLGRHQDLLRRLVDELPAHRYRVAAALHPHVWTWHGRRQIRAWHDASIRRGLVLLPPEEGWRAALVAADLVVGDHGSVSYYAAALGRPVLLAAFPEDEVDPDSQVAMLGRTAPRLDPDRSLRAQIATAILRHTPERHRAIRERASSAPGQAARRIRRAMYELLRLPEPDGTAWTMPVPAPVPLREVA